MTHTKQQSNNKKLKLGFAGTPELAATILKKILDSQEHQVTKVITQADKPAGRGRKLMMSAVKKLSLENNIDILQPSIAELATIEKIMPQLDLLVVLAYGILLPPNIINAPTYGCINIHTSLLPKWRGAAPIQRAIQARDDETGISIFQMDSGLDSGPILLQKKCNIDDHDTSGSLHDKLANLASECLADTLNRIVAGNIQAQEQDHTIASYARKISKQETIIDWTQSAQDIACMIRAFNPLPGCHTELAGIQLKIWYAEAINKQIPSTTGKILACKKTGIDITTGQGILRILQLQVQGGRRMSVADFLNGHPLLTTNN